MALMEIRDKRKHLWDRIQDFRVRYFDHSDEETRDAYYKAIGRGQFAGTAWEYGMFDICEQYVDDALEFIHICFAMHGEYDDESVSTIDSLTTTVL